MVLFNEQHRATEDFELRGYHFPKDTVVVPQIFAVNYDERLFHKAREFRCFTYVNPLVRSLC